jgi:hypothetical protein
MEWVRKEKTRNQELESRRRVKLLSLKPVREESSKVILQ